MLCGWVHHVFKVGKSDGTAHETLLWLNVPLSAWGPGSLPAATVPLMADGMADHHLQI